MKRIQYNREQAVNADDEDDVGQVQGYDRERPVLLVDEAAQALEAELIIPINYTEPRSMVLVGDPNQLPATLISIIAHDAGRGTIVLHTNLMRTYPSILFDNVILQVSLLCSD